MSWDLESAAVDGVKAPVKASSEAASRLQARDALELLYLLADFRPAARERTLRHSARGISPDVPAPRTERQSGPKRQGGA